MHTMDTLSIPRQDGLTEALGRLAIAHTHLELVLRYSIKTLSGITIQEALDAAAEERIHDLRKRLRKFFLEKKPTPTEESQIDALLGAAQRLSEKRSEFHHSAWSETQIGQAVLKGEDNKWQEAPKSANVDKVTHELLELVEKINNARLHGFVFTVVERHKNKMT